MKIKILIVVLFLLLATLAHAETIEQIKVHFSPGKFYQVNQDSEKYYILSSSPFKDAYARKHLALLSKSALYRFIKKTDKKITGIDVKGFGIDYFFEEKGRLFAISTINKKNIVPHYEEKLKENYTAIILKEITKLEAIDPKEKIIHEQLKDLYFLIGDIDNYEKQSDILLEIIFNED